MPVLRMHSMQDLRQEIKNGVCTGCGKPSEKCTCRTTDASVESGQAAKDAANVWTMIFLLRTKKVSVAN